MDPDNLKIFFLGRSRHLKNKWKLSAFLINYTLISKFFCVHHGERLVAQLLQRLLYGTWVVPQWCWAQVPECGRGWGLDYQSCLFPFAVEPTATDGGKTAAASGAVAATVVGSATDPFQQRRDAAQSVESASDGRRAAAADAAVAATVVGSATDLLQQSRDAATSCFL